MANTRDRLLNLGYTILFASIIGAGTIPAVAQDAAVPSKKSPSQESDLAGTFWQLVKIMSMDDSVHVPRDSSLYTLSFNRDGSVQVLADCNRGIGSWTSRSEGQLEFGPVATTRAQCQPGSLSEKFLSQFKWVRSYVMENENLYLATMADGSIIEFERGSTVPLAATVLGEEVRTTDAGEMQQIIMTRLFEQYARKNGINVLDSEIDAYVEYVQPVHREMARSIIMQRKVNRKL